MSSIKQILFFCNNCHYKNISNDLSNFRQHTISSIPLLYDKKNRKVNLKNRRKQVKCPSCGHVIIPRFLDENKNQITDASVELDHENSNES